MTKALKAEGRVRRSDSGANTDAETRQEDQHGEGRSAIECPGHIAEAGHHQPGKARDRGCGAQSEAGVGGFLKGWTDVDEEGEKVQ